MWHVMKYLIYKINTLVKEKDYNKKVKTLRKNKKI